MEFNGKPVDQLTRDETIAEWQKAKRLADEAKALELSLRARVISMSFPQQANDPSAEGVQNLDLHGGWKLKATFKVNYNLAKYDDVRKALTRIRELGTVDAQNAFSRLIKFSPELSLSEYRKIPADVRKIINEVITTKPGLPAIELIAPDNAKA